MSSQKTTFHRSTHITRKNTNIIFIFSLRSETKEIAMEEKHKGTKNTT